MSIRTIGLTTAIFALAFTMQSADAKAATPGASPTTKHSAAPKKHKMMKKPTSVKAVAPSHPGPQ